MFSQVPICALSQPDPITSPQRLKGLIVTPVWIPRPYPVWKSEKYLTVNNKTTASYLTIFVYQAYQTLQTIIKLILEAQVAQAWNMSIGIVA